MDAAGELHVLNPTLGSAVLSFTANGGRVSHEEIGLILDAIDSSHSFRESCRSLGHLSDSSVHGGTLEELVLLYVSEYPYPSDGVVVHIAKTLTAERISRRVSRVLSGWSNLTHGMAVRFPSGWSSLASNEITLGAFERIQAMQDICGLHDLHFTRI